MPEKLPESPASIMDEPLPSILGNEDDANTAILLEDEAATEVEAEAHKAEEQAEEQEDEAGGEDRAATQQRQQKLANREKAVLAAEARLEASQQRLEKLLEKFEASPTAANQAAVQQAQKQSVVAEAKAKIAAIKAAPNFDRYTDSDKIDEIWLTALEQLENGQQEVLNETKTSKAEREAAKQLAAVHDTYWNTFASKNPTIGREGGEQLWAKAMNDAKAAAKRSTDEGIPMTELEAAKLLFARLVAQARKNPTSPAAKKSPDVTGGRLGPTGGRTGNTPGKPRTLDDRLKAGEFNLSGIMD